MNLKGKKIAILGFGLEGKATFEYLKEKGFSSSILDQKEKKDFLAANPALAKADLKLGKEYLKALTDFDVVFRTPGVPISLPEIKQAIAKGVVFTSQLELFFEEAPCRIIGVTGTKGKGTTSSLIELILKKAGKDVYLGGNIGLPAISFLPRLTKDSIAVLELSSFQLQTLKKSPNIAVVLNVTQDHLDYHETVEEYREAKSNIVRYQQPSDVAVINADYQVPLSFSNLTAGKVCYFSRKKRVDGCYAKDGRILLDIKEGVIDIISTKELLLRGDHNLENVTAAILASHQAGADIASIKEAVSAFPGLEHRLELVREIKGVRYYNDSFSTVPETAIAAIRSFDEPKIVILGGSYKGSDYTALGETIRNANIKAVILIGEMADEISKAIGNNFQGKKIAGLTKMPEIVGKAAEIAEKGDVVLLSPACASFGLFQNYKDRGQQYKTAVEALG